MPALEGSPFGQGPDAITEHLQAHHRSDDHLSARLQVLERRGGDEIILVQVAVVVEENSVYILNS